jgi:hypothetical protein
MFIAIKNKYYKNKFRIEIYGLISIHLKSLLLRKEVLLFFGYLAGCLVTGDWFKYGKDELMYQNSEI